MNTIIRWENKWDPFKEMEGLHNRLTSLLSNALARPGNEGKESLTVAEWTPLVDIVENDKEYLIKAELPELKKDDIKVTVEDGVLIISGERKFEKEEKGKRYHRVERAYGSFARSFALPDDANPENVNAEFKDGVLKVRLTKDEKAQPKTIEVKTE